MTKNDGKECINSFGEDCISVSQADYDRLELAHGKSASMCMRGETLYVDKNDDGGLEVYYRKLYSNEYKIVPLMIGEHMDESEDESEDDYSDDVEPGVPAGQE